MAKEIEPVEEERMREAQMPEDPNEPDESQGESEDHEHDEDHHVSFAARSLQILALLAVGVALGLWAGPRIAPYLPQGLAPLAAWLSPQTNASTEALDELRSETATRLLALEEAQAAGIQREEIEARLANYQTDIVNPLRDQMAALSDQMAAADSTAVEARLWAVEGRVEGLVAELESLRGALGSLAEEGGAISADTAASIAAYRTRIDALQAQVDEITARQGELTRKMQQVQQSTSAQVEEAQALVEIASETAMGAQAKAVLVAGLAQVQTALQTGDDFSAALGRISEAAPLPVPEALAAVSGGVPSIEALELGFPIAAHAAIRAEISASGNDGGLSGLGSFLRAQVATRSLTPRQGDSADAVLSRMEAAMKSGDWSGVEAEAVGLSAPARAEMESWLADAKARVAALAAFETWREALEAMEQ